MQNFSAAPDSPGPHFSDSVRPSPQHPCTPPELSRPTWDFAARRLLAKMLGEFAYEEIIRPVPAPGSSGDAWTLTLADLDYAALEGHQTGHPWLVLNKGRIGLSASDTAAWAPEARTGQRLPWLAAHTSLAHYRGTAGLEDPARLYPAELAPSPAPSSTGPCGTAASTRSATSTSPSTPGSGTRSSCPSSPRPSAQAPWSRSPRIPISACPSSRSAPSSTSPAPTATASNCRSPSSTPWSGEGCPAT